MRRVYVTFGGAAYDKQIAKTAAWLEGSGIELRVYDDAWLMTTPFYKLNKWIFEIDESPGRGYHFGWCCWKAFIILQEFKRLNASDIVMYVDADTYPIADLTPLYEIAEREKIVLFEAQGVNNNRFTKAECFMAMAIPQSQWSSQHACGRFQLFTKGDWLCEQFLMDWNTYLLNPLCQFNQGSITMKDQPEFARHSSDQSSLSNLALKYGLPLHREACQNGWPVVPNAGQPGDTYPQMFVQEWADGDRNDVRGSKFRNV
jgi:hypothetical protein